MLCNYRHFRKSKDGSISLVPCGTCLACRVNKKTFWTNRIAYDVMYYNRLGYGSTFAGLSIDDNHLNSYRSVVKEDLQKVIKRLRHYSPIKFKHFSIGEYGSDSQRPHYHSILIGLPTEISKDVLRKSWTYGFTTAEPVTSGRIRYVVDYLDCTSSQGRKTFEDLGVEPPFNLHSNGIGSSLFDSQLDFIMTTGHYLSKGKLQPLTPYWLDKLGVPLNVRCLSTADLKSMLTKAKALGFKDFQAYQVDQAHTQELALYNRQINRLSPRYGHKPSRSSDYGFLIRQSVPSTDNIIF